MKIKSAQELRATIALHYTRDEKAAVVDKTSMALEMALALGMASNKLTFKMIDLGVKPAELGMSMALAMKRTDDKFLSRIDQHIKKIIMVSHADMLKGLEDVLN